MMTENKSDFLKIGWYQIIGGIVGECIVFFSPQIQVSGLDVLVYVYIFMLLFFVYSVFCGLLCITYKNNALTFSLINQFLQLIGFAFLGFSFTYVAGFYISIDLDFSNAEVGLSFGLSEFNFHLNQEYDGAGLHFNLIALGLISWIIKLSAKIKAEKRIIAKLEQ